MAIRRQRLQAWGIVMLMALALAGCAAMTGHQGAGEALSDSSITAKVKSSLLADSVVGATAGGGPVDGLRSDGRSRRLSRRRSRSRSGRRSSLPRGAVGIACEDFDGSAAASSVST